MLRNRRYKRNCQRFYESKRINPTAENNQKARRKSVGPFDCKIGCGINRAEDVIRCLDEYNRVHNLESLALLSAIRKNTKKKARKTTSTRVLRTFGGVREI